MVNRGVPAAEPRGVTGRGGAFVHQLPLVPGQGAEDPGEHPPCRRGVADPFPQRAEQDAGASELLDGADHRGQGPAEPVRGDDDADVSGADVVNQGRQSGPVVTGPGELVGEDPLGTGLPQRVRLCLEGLVIGADPRVPDDRRTGSVSEAGAVWVSAAPELRTLL